MQSLILDVQATSRSFDRNALAEVESFIAQGDRRKTVSPMALAIPTEKPMNSFDARTWPACFTEWWFGDGAPNLHSQRPMLFEECAQRLFDSEEMEYSMPTDEAQYVASARNRFVKPEIIAVLGGVARRMKMSRGTRAAIGRKGFDADLKTLANSTYEDFLEAMHISTPEESIVSAANRSDMPPKIRTALRTLLLSTSAVPGTEGRKKKLRYNGHANNLLWGPPSFFNTPSFADTYDPIVKLLHDGPSRDAHLRDYGRCVASSSSTPTLEGYLSTSAPRMPSLRRMHEIVAANPRAQARFSYL